MTKRYDGPLSHAQIDSGIESCLNHAERLRRIIEKATSAERGLGIVLACIRVEELTKILMLIEMRSGHPDQGRWSRFWKDFRDHRAKWQRYGKWRFQDLTDEQMALELGKVFSGWASTKNAGLYVDYEPSIGFVEPGLLPNFIESALKMGDELDEQLRSMLRSEKK